MSEDWTLQQKVDAQLEILGASLEAHPLELVQEKIAEPFPQLMPWERSVGV